MLTGLLRLMTAGFALALSGGIPYKTLGGYRACKQGLVGLGPEQAGNNIFRVEIAVMREHFLIICAACDPSP